MKISKLINKLSSIQDEYGDIEVVCYDNSSNNANLVDGTFEEDDIKVLFNESKGEDYVEIGFWPLTGDVPQEIIELNGNRYCL